jgi:hypothetical protein
VGRDMSIVKRRAQGVVLRLRISSREIADKK